MTIFQFLQDESLKFDELVYLFICFCFYCDRTVIFTIYCKVNRAKRPLTDFVKYVVSVLYDQISKL